MSGTKEKEETDNETVGVEEQDMRAWASMNKDMVEWMTEATDNNMGPRSDCG